MEKKHSLLTDEGIEAWIADPETGGVNKLRSMLNRNELTGARARIVADFIRRRDAFDAGLMEAKRLELEMRSVKAAEDSAEAAKRSARRAGWAIAISLAALFVSALPLIRGQ